MNTRIPYVIIYQFVEVVKLFMWLKLRAKKMKNKLSYFSITLNSRKNMYA